MVAEAFLKGIRIHATVIPDPPLIHQIERSAVLSSQVRNAVPGKMKDAVRIPTDIIRQYHLEY